jgi:hypothetical protein
MEEICTTPCPLLVTVAESTLVALTETFPNAKVDGFNVRCPTGALVPVPESKIVFGEDGSLLEIVMLPLSVPAAVGE